MASAMSGSRRSNSGHSLREVQSVLEFFQRNPLPAFGTDSYAAVAKTFYAKPGLRDRHAVHFPLMPIPEIAAGALIQRSIQDVVLFESIRLLTHGIPPLCIFSRILTLSG
jgi:hypothetical protein